MAVELEGGCLVSGLREGEPWSSRGVRVWTHAGANRGAEAISLRIVEIAPGLSPGLATPHTGDVVYVLEGTATLYLDGWEYEVEPDCGVFVRPGTILTAAVHGPGPLVLASSRCPDPEAAPDLVDPMTDTGGATRPERAPIVPLASRTRESAGDRWYRTLVDKGYGTREATQFVAGIPPGRAPDHVHSHEAVLCVLAGTGRMWAGESSTPIERGSCVFLPRGQSHCIENTGDGELRVLGVIHPAGKPGVRAP